MPLREAGECQQVVSGVVEHGRDLGMGATQHRDHLGELLADVLRVRLGKDCADGRGHHVLAALGDCGENVAHEMHPTALPTGALKDGADRFL